MMLSEKDIITLYKILLGRKPENEQIIKYHLKNSSSIYQMCRNITSSYEFRKNFFKKYIPEKVIIFIHIPKTAGSYLRSGWLLKNINKNSYWWFDEKRRFPKLENFKKNYTIASSYSLIGGHLDMNTFLQMKIIQPKIILNIQREPVSRIISFYNHIKNRDKLHPFHKQAKNSSLFELLNKRGVFYKHILNQQINFLLANESNINNFSDRDKLIIGKQNNIEPFIETVNKIVGFKKSLGRGRENRGEEHYIESIKSEKNFSYALEILDRMTKYERKFYESLDEVTIMSKKEYLNFIKEYSILKKGKI